MLIVEFSAQLLMISDLGLTYPYNHFSPPPPPPTLQLYESLPNCKYSLTCILSQCKFHKHQWQTTEKQHDYVGNKKSSTSISEAQKRESPHVSEPHGVSQTGKKEFDGVIPIPTILIFVFRRNWRERFRRNSMHPRECYYRSF